MNSQTAPKLCGVGNPHMPHEWFPEEGEPREWGNGPFRCRGGVIQNLLDIDIQSYAHRDIHSNECILCKKTPSVGFVSFFLKGKFGTHLIIHLCEKHWNDIGIFQALSQVFTEKAAVQAVR